MQIEPFDAQMSKKYLFSHHNNNIMIKRKSLFDTALVMTITNILNLKDFFLLMGSRRSQQRHDSI